MNPILEDKSTRERLDRLARILESHAQFLWLDPRTSELGLRSASDEKTTHDTVTSNSIYS